MKDPATRDVEGLGGKAQYRAPALEKGLDIIELLTAEPVPLTLTAIAQRLDRSQSEIFRMIQVLESRGYIGQEPATNGYHLTDLLFSMVMQRPATQSLVETAIPIMRSLAADIGQSCHLAFHSRGDIVVVARMESMEQIGFTVRVGYRRPIINTVSGLTLFAFQPPDVRARWIALIDLQLPTTKLAAFVAEADEVQRNGFAQKDSSFVDGVTDISAPIMRGDRAAAALTVPYINTTSARGGTGDVSAKLVHAAQAIAEGLSEADSRA